MSQVLNKVRDVDPNNSDAVKEVLATFFQNLTKHTAGDCNRWLRALENIINRFPKFCGTHRNTIETYLTHIFYTAKYYNVIEAAKCAHALQQVRPSQEKAATPKACWREHVAKLINAAHNLISAMFPNSVDMYKNIGNVQKLHLQSSTTSPLSVALDQINQVPKTQTENVNKQTLFSTRLRNVFVFIQASLVEIYPVPKPIQPQTILEVIVRALSISSGAKLNMDINTIVSVKIQALRTLDALVACLGPNLIPFSGLIFKFGLQTLKWCSENVNEESSVVRRGAYDSLRRWVRALNAHRLADCTRGRGWEDELTNHIVQDITPHKRVVQLTMSNQSTKNLSKKARRKLANSMIQESTIASHTPGEKNKIPISQDANDDVALAALDFAEAFLHVCGVFLKPTTHKLFQERLVRECYSLHSHSAPRALALVRVLDALRRTTPNNVAPPTQYCLQLYSALVSSSVDEISKFASQALLDIRLHLHCSPPTLSFALAPPVPHANDKPKKMSAKNRAALESLLGADKLPSDTTEEVITLSDEPSKKKPRLDADIEIADKISVSSESASSVEISDDDSDVQEVDADDEIDGNVGPPVSSENTADTNENTGDTDEKPEHKHKESTANVFQSTTEEESQTKEASAEAKTNDEESRDTTDTSKSTEQTEESATSTTHEGDTNDGGTRNIYTANTQLPLNSSVDSSGERYSSHSREVTYDLTSNGTEKVTILEKQDDDLPCTNETDDVPITCGQIPKNSQDDIEKNKENEEPKMNGDKSPEKGANVLTDKAGSNVNVEDMLADFVDEINEEKTEA